MMDIVGGYFDTVILLKSKVQIRVIPVLCVSC